MPDKPGHNGYDIAHDIFDLRGPGGFETVVPPRVPGTKPIIDDGTGPRRPELLNPNIANVYWDTEEEQLFTFDPDAEDPDELGFTQISPFLESVYYDPDTDTLYYWDGEQFVEIPFEELAGDSNVYLVFTSPPRMVAPDEESSPVTVERRDALDNLLTIGALDVYLYSTDPDMTFLFEGNPVTGVTLANGESSFTFTFTTPTSGNPVITASDEVLS